MARDVELRRYRPHLGRRTGAARFVLEGHSGGVNTGDWSPDSERFVTGSDDGTARVWAITQQGVKEALVLSARDTRNGVMGVVFSPDGRFVMAGNFAVTAVHVWDVSPAGSAEWANLARGRLSVSPAFSPDGAALSPAAWIRPVTGCGTVSSPVGHRDLGGGRARSDQ